MLNNYFTTADFQVGTASTVSKEEITAASVFGIFEEAAQAGATNPVWYSDVFSADESADPATKLQVITLDVAFLHITSSLKMMRLAPPTILRYL